MVSIIRCTDAINITFLYTVYFHFVKNYVYASAPVLNVWCNKIELFRIVA